MKNYLKFFIVMSLIFVSCENSETSDVESLTFEDLEIEFKMKQSFSENAKASILNKYGSIENYLEFVNLRKQEIEENKPLYSNKALYKVRLYNYNVGLDDVIDCPDNEYILDVAEVEGIDLPYSDRAGASSTCAAILNQGEIDQADQSFLNDEQMSAGWVLLCVAYPKQDCDITTHMEEGLY
jgi:ferredoxin